MNQKQIFTEYWRILDDFEDYLTDGFSRGRSAVPDFKLRLEAALPPDPHDCTACPLHEQNELRAPYRGDDRCRLLIVNRILPGAFAGEKIQFSAEEKAFIAKWLEAIDLDLERDCAVISRIQCPAGDPSVAGKEALESCFPYLERAMKNGEPEAVLQLGMDDSSSLEGRTGKIPFFRTYHPSDVLIDGALKRPVWETLKKLKDTLVEP